VGFGLLRIPEVQQDLGLTDAQKVQVLALSMEMRGGHGDAGKKLESALRPEQIRRLKQIRLQVDGPAGLLGSEVASALELSPEQIRQLKALQDHVRDTVRQAFQDTKDLTQEQRRAKMPELFEKLQQVRKETSDKALEVLTEKQRGKFDTMQGPKIDLTGMSRSPSKASPQPPASDSDSK
jgi:hypothetical protein